MYISFGGKDKQGEWITDKAQKQLKFKDSYVYYDGKLIPYKKYEAMILGLESEK